MSPGLVRCVNSTTTITLADLIAWNPGVSQLGFVGSSNCGLFLARMSVAQFIPGSSGFVHDLSCISVGKVCSVSYAIPFTKGLLVIDLNRLVRFDASILSVGIPVGREIDLGSPIASIGQASVPTILRYPTSVCVYEPFNSTHVSSGTDPVFNTPYRVKTAVDGGSFAFLSDFGNDRLCVINMTDPQQLDMLTCKTVTGPLYCVIMFAPSWEPGLSTANLFVTTMSQLLIKFDFSATNATLSIGDILDLPCPGKGVDILNGAIIVVVLGCDQILAVSINLGKMYVVNSFVIPANLFLFGQILITAPDITGQKNLILTGGYVDSLSISSLFITVALPRSITILDHPSRPLKFLSTCFNVTSSISPPRDLIEQACLDFNISTTILTSLYTQPFNYELLNSLFFVPYNRVIINCPTASSGPTGSDSSPPTRNIPHVRMSINGCLLILIIIVLIL